MRKKLLITIPILLCLFGAIFAVCFSILTSSNQYVLKSDKFDSIVEFNGEVDIDKLTIYDKEANREISAEEFSIVSCDDTSTTGTKTLIIQYNNREFKINFEVKYKVEFKVDDNVISTQYVNYANEISVPQNVYKVGYEFISWDKQVPSTLTNNITFEAIMSSTTLIVPELNAIDVEYGSTLGEIVLPSNQNGQWEFVDDLTTKVGSADNGYKFDVKFVPVTSELVEKYDTITINVKKKELEFNIIQDVFVYDGKPHFPIYALPVQGLTIDVIGNSETNASNNKHTYALVIVDSNYSGYYSGTFLIKKADVTIKVDDKIADYNQDFEMTYTVQGFDDVEILGIQLDKYTQKNAGTYEIGATSSNTNINLIVEKGQLTINKIDLNPRPQNPTLLKPEDVLTYATYGDKLSNISIANDFQNGYWRWENPEAIIDKVQGFSAYAIFTPTSANFNAERREIFIDDIAKKTLNINVTKCEYVYDGTEHSLMYNVENNAYGEINVVNNVCKTDVGDYTTTLSIEHEFYKGSVSAKLVIIKATPKTEFDKIKYVVTYTDGIKLDDVKILEKGYSWLNTQTKLTEVDTILYPAVFTPADTKNYNEVAGEIAVTLNKAESSVLGVNERYETTYTGNQLYTYGIAGVKTSHYDVGAKLEYKYFYNNKQVENIENAGEYLVEITSVETKYYLPSTTYTTVIVNKASVDVVMQSLEAVYEQTLNDVNIAQEEDDDGAWSWKESLDTPVGNVGVQHHTAIYTPKNSNYAVKEVEATINVLAKNLTFDKNSLVNVYTYDGEEHKIEYLLVDDKGVNYNSLSVSGNNAYVNADVYSITLTVDNPNYNARLDTTLTINRKEIVKDAPTDITATYLDTLKDVQLPTYDDGFWKWNIDTYTKVGNAGNNQFDAIFIFNEPDGEDNYKDYSAKINVLVNKKIVEKPTLKSNSAIYTNDTIKADISDTNEYFVAENGWVNAGDYNVVLTLKDSENYVWSTTDDESVQLPFTINPGKAKITGLTIGEWTYNTTPCAPSANTNFGTINYFYSDEENGIYTETQPINAGTHYVKAVVEYNDNYDGDEAVISFVINKAKIEKFDIPSKAYSGNLLTATVPSSKLYNVTINNGGINVGNYEVELTIVDFNYKWFNGSETTIVLPFEIVKNSAKISNLTLDGWTFNQQPNQPSATTNFGTINYTYSTSKNGVYTDTQPVDAGTYYVMASVEGTDNYDGYSCTKSFTIERAGIDKPIIVSKLYTGTRLYADVSSNNIYTVTQDGGIVVGFYPVYVTIVDYNYKWSDGSDDAITLMFEIEKSQAVLIDFEVEGWTFGENATELNVTTNFEGVEVKCSYLTQEEIDEYLASQASKESQEPNYEPSSDVTSSYPKYKTEHNARASKLQMPTEAGTYYIKMVVDPTENFEGIIKIISFVIEKATINEIVLQPAIYTGLNLTSGLITNDKYKVEETAVSEVGDYEVKLTILNKNYKWWNDSETTITLTFKIIKGQAEISGLTMNDWTYGQISSVPSANSNFGQIEYTYSTSENGEFVSIKPTDAGTYYVKASVKDTNNYNGTEKVTKFVINKCEVNIPSIDSKVYTGKTLTADIESSSIYSVIKNDGGIEKGEYDVELKLNYSNNYKWADSEDAKLKLKFEITSALNIWESQPYISGWVYGQTASIPQARATFGNIVIDYKSQNSTDDNYSTTKPTNAGAYVARFSVAGTNDYNSLRSIVSFVISKAEIITPEVESKIYTGDILTADILATEQYSVVANDGGIDVGAYPVKLGIIDNNYKWKDSNETTIEIDFNITPAQAQITDFDLEDYVFGGNVSNSSASTNFGEVVYTYSSSIDGEYTSTKPTNAGTYYVKAEVPETTNYAGAVEITTFTISKAEVPVPSVSSKVYTGTTLTADIVSNNIYKVSRNNGGVNVGSYEVELTITDTNYKWTTGSEDIETISFEITKAQAEISGLAIADWTYGEEASSPRATSNFGVIDYTYSNAEEGNYVEEKPTNAGTYYVKANVEETVNYGGASAIKQFVIDKGQAIISNLAIADWTYGENASTPSATTNFGSVEYTYANSSKENYITEQPTEAGIYYLKAKVESASNYLGAIQIISFEIKQASNEITALSINGWTYGETVNEPTASAVWGTPEFSYSSSIDGEYTATKPTNAGTYYVKAEVPETTNYAGAVEITTFTISKAEVPVPTISSKVYTGTTLTADIVSNNIYKVSKNNGGVNVGSYEVELTITDTNYKWTTGSEDLETISFEITKAQAEISGLAIADWTYGEEASSPRATSNFGVIDYTYSNAEEGNYVEDKPTNAGTYYVKANVEETVNYGGASAIKQFVIDKAVVNAPVVGSKVYTGETLTADVSSTDIYTVTKNNGGIECGNYIVELSIVDTNYKWPNGSVTTIEIPFVITQATNSITSLKLLGWTYGETANEPTASAVWGTPEFSYSSSIDGEYTATKPTNSGTYYVKAEVKQTSNYFGASKVISFTIEKAFAQITSFAISDWTYSQNASKPTIAASSFVKANDITYYYKTSTSNWTSTVPTNAGSYIAKAVIADTSSFDGCESAEITFSINKAKPTLTAPTYGTIYMNVDNLSTCHTTAPSAKNLANATVPGTWTYGAITYANGANASKFTLTFNPSDTSNYESNNVDVNITVKAVARMDGIYYPTIESALDVASSGKTVFVEADITGKVVIKQNCEVKSGVTLVLPYGPNDTDRCSDGKATLHSGISKEYNGIANLALKNLVIVDSNVVITNNGIIEVAGELSGGQGGSAYAGHTARNYAELRLNSGAIINSTGEIKVTGFINESSLNNGSQININQGTMYIPFVMRDFRGGSYMYAAYNAKYGGGFLGIGAKSCEISPFNQYQLRNISSKFVVKYSGNLKVYANMYANSENQPCTINFVGSASSNMFQFTDSTYSRLECKYNPTTGVIKADMYGGVTMNTLTLSLAGTSINTSKTYFPLPWTINISLNRAVGQDNATYTLNQKIKIMPGCEVVVGQGTTVNANYVTVYSSYTDTTEVSAETKYPSKPAAKLTINGTFNCSNFGGNIYSSTEGATVAISSSSSMTTYETTGPVSGSSIFASISTKTITNATNFYYGTTCQISSASTGTYKFTNGKWTKQ